MTKSATFDLINPFSLRRLYRRRKLERLERKRQARIILLSEIRSALIEVVDDDTWMRHSQCPDGQDLFGVDDGYGCVAWTPFSEGMRFKDISFGGIDFIELLVILGERPGVDIPYGLDLANTPTVGALLDAAT